MGKDREKTYAQDGAIEIGSTLKRAREDLGLSHEDVERATNIRERYVEAIEQEDYGALPGTVYAQGFLKTYANYLNLDGEKFSEELKNQWDVLRRQRSESEPPSSRPASARSSSRSRRRSRTRRSPFPLAAVGGLVLTILVLVVAVGGLYSVGQRVMQASNGAGAEASAGQEDGSSPGSDSASSESSESAAPGDDNESSGATRPEERTTEPAATQSEDTQSQPPPGAESAQKEANPATPPVSESLTMVVRVDGNISWLSIQTDDNVVFEQVANPGFVRTFEAEDSITVWSGNAGAVFLEINGQNYGVFGQSGETKLQEFTLKASEGQR